MNPIKYINESIAELKKVVWPTKIETFRLTVLVVIVSVVVGAYITSLDAIFARILEQFAK